MQHARRIVALLAVTFLSSCAAGGATEGACTVGADCASGVCQDGRMPRRLERRQRQTDIIDWLALKRH